MCLYAFNSARGKGLPLCIDIYGRWFLDALGLQGHGLNSGTLYSLQWEISLNSERMAFIKKECLPPIGSFAELATCTGVDM